MDKPEFPALTDVIDTAEGSAILATACNDDETARSLREKVTLASAELAALIAERDALRAIAKEYARWSLCGPSGGKLVGRVSPEDAELARSEHGFPADWTVQPDNAAARYLDAKAKEKERGEK